MNKGKKNKLTEHISYLIVNDTIYLFQNSEYISSDEVKILEKKLALIIQDNDISYINISSKKMEDRKDFYQKLGFSLSYYDVNKLNILYKGMKNKRDYRCYGIMTRSDFFDRINNSLDGDKEDLLIVNNSSGYIYDLFLLFGGILLLCYFCVQGAIYLVRQNGGIL